MALLARLFRLEIAVAGAPAYQMTGRVAFVEISPDSVPRSPLDGVTRNVDQELAVTAQDESVASPASPAAAPVHLNRNDDLLAGFIGRDPDNVVHVLAHVVDAVMTFLVIELYEIACHRYVDR